MLIHFDTAKKGLLVFETVKLFFDFLYFLMMALLLNSVTLQPAQAQVKKKNVQARTAISSKNEANIKIKEISIIGLKKIEEAAVKVKISSRVGDLVSPKRVKEDIQHIYRMGFFDDIQVEISDLGLLTIKLIEKPSLVEVKFQGNDEVKEDDLKEAIGIKAFEVLDPAKIKTSLEKLRQFYEGKGYFLAKVESVIESSVEGDGVRLIFKIEEGEKVKIQKITFLGNSQLSDDFLKGKMATTEAGFFSFMSGSGAFKQEAYDRDLQFLRLIYLNEGFVQAKIDRPQVFVTPDRKNIYLTYRIEEGERYKVGELEFAGDLLFSKTELLEGLELANKEYFSYETMQKDLMVLQAKYGDLGYAYTNVVPRTRTNDRDKVVDIVFEFDKGSKVYFGRFTITGNKKTRDRVVRRELRIYEGELYNETRKRRSFENINRLGFFENVNFKTSSDPSDPNRMDIEIELKERSTGNVSGGAGYGTVTGGTLQFSLAETNWAGRGQRVNVSLNSSRIGSFYNFNFTQPNVNDTDWLFGFDLYQSGVDRFEYEERKVGMRGRFGQNLSDNLLISLQYRLDKVQLNPYTGPFVVTDQEVFNLERASGFLSSVTASIDYDERDDRFAPSKGKFASLWLEYAGVGGDIKFTKTNVTFRYFKKVVWDVVWRNNLVHSYLTSHDPNFEPPFNERFLLGGPYSLRGYRIFRIGSSRFSNTLYQRNLLTMPEAMARERANIPFGGLQQLLYQTELEFPMIKEAGIKGVVFFDVGQAEDVLAADSFFSSVGFGFRWISPMGPLRFEWGFPLQKTAVSPEAMIFDFSIGAPF